MKNYINYKIINKIINLSVKSFFPGFFQFYNFVAFGIVLENYGLGGVGVYGRGGLVDWLEVGLELSLVQKLFVVICMGRLRDWGREAWGFKIGAVGLEGDYE